MKLKRGKIKDILSYLVISLFTFTAVMLIMVNKNIKIEQISLFTKFQNEKFILQNQENIQEFIKYLKNTVRESFTTYLDYCPLADEINLKTKECINNYNFSTTLLESLETLYLLDMKDLISKANKYIKKFSCNDIEWVNKRELWSRGIGSLIGAFLLSNDRLYLKKATECANIIISNKENNMFAPFINLKTGQFHYRPRENEMFQLSDSTAGLPELLSLYALTNDNSYNKVFNKLLLSLPNNENETFYSLYSPKHKNEHSKDNKLNAKTLGFYYNLAISSKLTKNKVIHSKYIKHFSKNLEFNNDYSRAQIPVLLVSQLLDEKYNRQNELLHNIIKDYSLPYSFLTKTGPNQLQTFSFDGSYLLYLLKNGDVSKIIELVMTTLNFCRTNDGISGVARSMNEERIYFTNIQHSSFFGQWAKYAAISILENPPNLDQSIFNERGHILKLPSQD